MNWTSEQDAAPAGRRRLARGPPAPQVFRVVRLCRSTGKTTLARHLAEHVDGETAFAAFYGQGALVLRSKGCGGRTIHSLIYRPWSRFRGAPFVLNEDARPPPPA